MNTSIEKQGKKKSKSRRGTSHAKKSSNKKEPPCYQQDYGRYNPNTLDFQKGIATNSKPPSGGKSSSSGSSQEESRHDAGSPTCVTDLAWFDNYTVGSSMPPPPSMSDDGFGGDDDDYYFYEDTSTIGWHQSHAEAAEAAFSGDDDDDDEYCGYNDHPIGTNYYYASYDYHEIYCQQSTGADTETFGGNDSCWDDGTFRSYATSEFASFAGSDNENEQLATPIHFSHPFSSSSTTSSDCSSITAPPCPPPRRREDAMVYPRIQYHSQDYHTRSSTAPAFGELVRNEQFAARGHRLQQKQEIEQDPAVKRLSSFRSSTSNPFLRSPLFTFRRRFNKDTLYECTVEARVDPGEEETMAQLVGRTLQMHNTGVLAFSTKERKAIQRGYKEIVFVLAQIHRVTLTRKEFGKMKASDLLHFTSKRPLLIDIESEDSTYLETMYQQSF